MKAEELLALIVAIAIIIKVTIFNDILLFYDSLWVNLENLEISLVLISQSSLRFAFSWKGLISLLIILIPFILIINYRLNIKLSNLFHKRNERIRKLEEEKKIIESLLKIKIKRLDIKELSNHIENLKEKIKFINKDFKKLKPFKELLLEKEKTSLKHLKKLKRERILQKYRDEKERLKQESEEIKKENQRLLEERENANWHILNRLNAERTNVFLKEDLIEEEVDALRENGFEDANEYDVCEKRIIPVLVKRILNHSKTHTFLVWSVKELLEEMEEDIEDVEVHDTRYPDITFTYNEKEFAIEVECGSLLKKKKQMSDKVKFLNKTFEDRWIFVVSNKNLLSKYRKHGFATQRSEVEKTIKKWLNSDI